MTDSIFRLGRWQPETAVQLIDIRQAALNDADVDLQSSIPEIADALAAARFAQKLVPPGRRHHVRAGDPRRRTSSRPAIPGHDS